MAAMLRWWSCRGAFGRTKLEAGPSPSCALRAGRFQVGDWFYFAGVWRPATRDWPEAYAILTIEANDDVAPFHDRQMAVLRREQRMAWLDWICPAEKLLRPLPSGTFAVSRLREPSQQATFVF
jgi:putative SOS response-associated peptidase YedK